MKYLRLLFLSLVLISCKKVEFEKISSSFWNPKLALPIAYGTFTISDILNQADSIDKYIDPDKRPLLQLKLSESINGFTIADAVKIPDFNSLPEQSVYSFSKLSTNDLNKGDFRLLETDNDLVLPVNTKIKLIVSSADVIHC